MNEMTESTPPAGTISPAATAMAKAAGWTERCLDASAQWVQNHPLGAFLATLGLGYLAGVALRPDRRSARERFFADPGAEVRAFFAGRTLGERRARARALGGLRRILHLS